VRADRPVVIDGKDDDPVWRLAPAITEFREFQPKEDGDPRFATEAKVAYDSRNFYVFVRAFDPHPDSILKLLARRDVRAATDQIKIIIDSYHDRRTGFEFAVNPAGVKRDYAIYNDGQTEDDAWDAVWDVATTVDSLGWTAEFRIPLSQLRYAPAATNTFGFGVWRDIQRYTERVSWPVYRASRPGFPSQMGEVQGLVGLSSPRRLEVTPYGVTKNVTVADGGAFDHPQRFAGGADIKYGVTSNLTLDATVNPDFGQVEADPAVLNLTAFETFFQERRPFFVAGTGVFRFDVNCSQVNCNSEGLFYSRRVGRAPHLTDLYGDASSPTGTTIMGAGKLTGRLAGGLNLGVLEGVTARETGPQDRTIEPLTNYAVVRAFQDLRHGESGVGVIATVVDRNLDVWTDPYLRQSAYAGAVDFRHRFPGGRYQLSGSLDLSRVAGTRQAIAATQQSSVHNYQRPDGSQTFDSTRTTLMGDAEELLFGKVGGGITRFETSYLRRSPGFEVNDLGFRAMPKSCSSARWAVALRGSRRAISAALPGSRSTTWASCSGRITRAGTTGSGCSRCIRAPSIRPRFGTSTGGSIGRRTGLRWNAPPTATCTCSSTTARGCTRAPLSVSSARPSVTAARGAGRRCGPIPTSRRGRSGMAMAGHRWCRSCGATTGAATAAARSRSSSTPR